MRVTVRETIEDVVIRFAWAYDEGDIAAAADVFAEDATLEVSVPGLPPSVGGRRLRRSWVKPAPPAPPAVSNRGTW